jgi:hypothetical protein
MIKSKLISDILDLLLDGDSFGLPVKQQRNYLTEAEYNYTGVGLFLRFNRLDGIENFRLAKEKLILNGVVITSKELNIGAEATLFFDNGLVDYLEIWSFDGEYPRKELETYTLKQDWIGHQAEK